MSQRIELAQLFQVSSAWGGAATQTSSSADVFNANEVTILLSFGLPLGVSASNYTYFELLESDTAISSSTPSSDAVPYNAGHIIYLPGNFSWSAVTDRRSTEIFRVFSTAVNAKLYKLAFVPQKRYVGLRMTRVGSTQTLSLTAAAILGRLKRTPSTF